MSDDVLSAREALEKAFASQEPETEAPVVEAEAPVAEAAAEEAPVAEGGRERDEFGRFKAKEAVAEPVEPAPVAEAHQPAPEVEPAPKGFQPSAQADWAKTPESVRADVARRFGEMESGLNEYRQRFEPLKRYDEMARAGGTTLDAALANYTHIEQTLARNPVEGIDLILRNMGTDVRSFAAHILGQPAPEANAQVSQLRQQLAAMERELTGYRTEKERTVASQVSEFATANPRFNELSEDIAWLLKTGGARDLATAYRKAELMNPLPATAQTGASAASAASPALAPQKPSGPVSIKGAPSSGSSPVRSTEIMSAREALLRAAAATR